MKAAVEADLAACLTKRPPLAYVDSSRGITNLHVPSDVIIDASMPVVVRDSGMMWNKDDALEDTMALIPDRCYATMYQVGIPSPSTTFHHLPSIIPDRCTPPCSRR